jgi:hypothetical protein
MAFQDAQGVTAISFTVHGNTTMTDRDITVLDLEALESELIAAAAAGYITWSVRDDPAALSDGLANDLYTYRPGATGVNAPGGNVFTDWTLLMAALDATKHFGERRVVFDNSFQNPAPIPAGIWDVTGHRWTNGPRRTFVEILNGAQFVIDPPTAAGPNRLVIDGSGVFSFRYDGVGPIVPFDGIDILCPGESALFGNTNPAAGPMFRVQGLNSIVLSGACILGGYGDYPSGLLAAPVVDLNGGELFIQGGAGQIANGFATDLSGGPGGLVLANVYNSLTGDFDAGLRDQWNAPALFAAGGAVFFDFVSDAVRYRVDPFFLGLPVVPATSPWEASYNEFVPVDTTLGGVTVNLPSAQRSFGERLTVKDVVGNAAVNPITIASTYGDAIEGVSAVIETAFGSKTFVCWGPGTWSLESEVKGAVPWPDPQTEKVIFVRNAGDDDTGDGKTELTAYRHIPRAFQDIPNPIPPGYSYIVDDTDLIDTLPDNYVIPAFACPDTARGYNLDNPFFFYETSVDLRATPRLVEGFSEADLTISASDIFSVWRNPRSKTLTITLTAPRTSWAANGLKNKFAIGAGDNLEHCYVGNTTDAGGVNGGATMELAEINLPTMPFKIMEASAVLTGTNTVFGHGALNAFNVGSLGFSGQKIINSGGDWSLYTGGCGYSVLQLCELEGPNLELGTNLINGFVRNAIKTYCWITGNYVCVNGGFDQCYFSSPLGNAPAKIILLNTIVDGCDPIGVDMDNIGSAVFPDNRPAGTSYLALTNTVVRNGTGGPSGTNGNVSFHGVAGHLENVDLSGGVGPGLVADKGAGYLELINVGTTGAPNGIAGVLVDDGLHVHVDAATSCPVHSGTGGAVGDEFTFADPIVTLTIVGGPFTFKMDGAYVTIDGATTPENNGLFKVTFIDAFNISWENPDGVAEAFPGTGTWATAQPLVGGGVDIKVGDSTARTWVDFTDAVPGSGKPQYDELDFAAAGAFFTGSGSRLSQ